MPGTNDALKRTGERLNELSPLLQHRTRLGTLVLLADADALSFSRLKDLLRETDGNLGAHLRKLEEAGFVGVKKEFVDRKPVSWYALTDDGFKVLRKHLQALGDVIKTVNGREKS